MKPGGSCLNPNAASYVPLSKRAVNTGSPGKGMGASESYIGFTQGHDVRNPWFGPNLHQTGGFPVGGAPAPQSHHASGSSSHHVAMSEKLLSDEMFDMHLEYLQMRFPDLSHESLSDVYIANSGDMEASIDMLHELEFDPYGSPENLPDTLDIGDVSETVPAINLDTSKLKDVANEGADASSSAFPPTLN